MLKIKKELTYPTLVSNQIPRLQVCRPTSETIFTQKEPLFHSCSRVSRFAPAPVSIKLLNHIITDFQTHWIIHLTLTGHRKRKNNPMCFRFSLLEGCLVRPSSIGWKVDALHYSGSLPSSANELAPIFYTVPGWWGQLLSRLPQVCKILH